MTIDDVSKERTSASIVAIEQLLKKLNVDQILSFRKRAKEIQIEQMDLIARILAEKGYIEPHHEGLLDHGRD